MFSNTNLATRHGSADVRKLVTIVAFVYSPFVLLLLAGAVIRLS